MGYVPPHFQISNWGARLKLMTINRDLDGRYSSILRTSVSFSCVFFRLFAQPIAGGGGRHIQKKNTEIIATKKTILLCFIFVFLWSQSHTVVTLGASVYSINSHRLLRAPPSTLTTRHEVDS